MSGHPEQRVPGWQGLVLLSTAITGSAVGTAPPTAALSHASHFLPGLREVSATHLHTSGTMVSTPSSKAAADYSFFKKHLAQTESFPPYLKKPSQCCIIRAEKTDEQSCLLTCSLKGSKTIRWKPLHVQFLMCGWGRVWTQLFQLMSVCFPGGNSHGYNLIETVTVTRWCWSLFSPAARFASKKSLCHQCHPTSWYYTWPWFQVCYYINLATQLLAIFIPMRFTLHCYRCIENQI